MLQVFDAYISNVATAPQRVRIVAKMVFGWSDFSITANAFSKPLSMRSRRAAWSGIWKAKALSGQRRRRFPGLSVDHTKNLRPRSKVIPDAAISPPESRSSRWSLVQGDHVNDVTSSGSLCLRGCQTRTTDAFVIDMSNFFQIVIIFMFPDIDIRAAKRVSVAVCEAGRV